MDYLTLLVRPPYYPLLSWQHFSLSSSAETMVEAAFHTVQSSWEQQSRQTVCKVTPGSGNRKGSSKGK